MQEIAHSVQTNNDMIFCKINFDIISQYTNLLMSKCNVIFRVYQMWDHNSSFLLLFDNILTPNVGAP